MLSIARVGSLVLSPANLNFPGLPLRFHSPFSAPIELLLSIKSKQVSCTLAIFYHPPSMGVLFSLQQVLESLPHSILLNLVLLDDFNVNFLLRIPLLLILFLTHSLLGKLYPILLTFLLLPNRPCFHTFFF